MSLNLNVLADLDTVSWHCHSIWPCESDTPMPRGPGGQDAAPEPQEPDMGAAESDSHSEDMGARLRFRTPVNLMEELD